MIGTLNVGLDEAGGRSPIEEKLNLTSFIIILNLLWSVSRWIKEAFYCYPGGGFFFFFAKYGLQIAASSPFFKLKNIKKIPASKCDGFICTLQIYSTYFSVLLCLKCFRVRCRFLRKPAPTTIGPCRAFAVYLANPGILLLV